jgi:AraC-like DNA-binding protein
MRVSPINLKILAYTLDVEGFDSSPVLRACGVQSIDNLAEDGEWVSAALFDRAMAAALEATGDAAFGLVAGKSLALMKYGALVPLVLPAPSLRQILDDLQQFAPLTVEHSEIELAEEPQGTRLVIRPVVSGGLSGHFRLVQIATSAVQLLRFAGAGSSDILHVDLPHAPDEAHQQRYAATFGPRIRFERKACSIAFNPALLDSRLPAHDPVSYGAARTRVASLLAAKQAGSGMADRVRQWLLRTLPQLPTACEAAQHLGMNERSFRRQLSTLGTSYAELMQECQRLTAERLLAEGKLPLKQIADALGFSSVHSFHRAFRRWSGATPSSWREGQSAKS